MSVKRYEVIPVWGINYIGFSKSYIYLIRYYPDGKVIQWNTNTKSIERIVHSTYIDDAFQAKPGDDIYLKFRDDTISILKIEDMESETGDQISLLKSHSKIIENSNNNIANFINDDTRIYYCDYSSLINGRYKTSMVFTSKDYIVGFNIYKNLAYIIHYNNIEIVPIDHFNIL